MADRPDLQTIRTGAKGRPHALTDPDFAYSVAQAFVAGCTREQMCDMFSVKDPATITRWRKDPRVKSIALTLIEDRILTVTRKVDAQIEARLAQAEKMSVKELLDVRKEYLGGALRQQTERADEDQVNAAQKFLEDSPEMAAQLDEMLRTGNIPGTPKE